MFRQDGKTHTHTEKAKVFYMTTHNWLSIESQMGEHSFHVSCVPISESVSNQLALGWHLIGT